MSYKRISFIVLVILLPMIVTQAMQKAAAEDWVLTIYVEKKPIEILLMGEKASLNPYNPPHVTLMWLSNINKHDPRFQQLANNLKDIATKFVSSNKEVFISNVNSFPAGGIYLEPSATSKEQLKKLYEQLRSEISKAGFDAHINHRLKTFTPHVTLLEAAQANSTFTHPTKMSFMKSLNAKLAHQLKLPYIKATSWFQPSK